jgi:hypothetical protein
MIRTNDEMSAAMFSGATQYPSTQRPWKNELCATRGQKPVPDQQGSAYMRPPRSCEGRQRQKLGAEGRTLTFA